MLEDSPQLRPHEVVQLAKLHVLCLPHTVIGTLGWRYAESFYGYVGGAATEHLQVHQEEDRVLAAAVLSEDVGRLISHLRHHTPLIRHFLGGLPTPGRWRAVRTLWRLASESSRSSVDQKIPELVFLFTDESFRRRGVARGLLERIETLLRALGHDRYDVRTKNTADNQASQFYANQGFSLLTTHGGIQYWRKNID